MMETEVSRVRSLLRTLALYVEARGRLLQIEAQEAGTHLSEIAILVAVACGSLLFGGMLALPALVWLVAETMHWPWYQVALCASGILVFLGIVFLITLKVRLKKLRIFEETFHQFQRDRECLGNPPPGL